MRDVKDPEARRAEIMEAALALFMEQGYLNTTTQDIIERVHISRGLLYYHFKNKEDILSCLVERYSRPLVSKLTAIAYGQEQSALEKMRRFLDATLVSPGEVTREGAALQTTVDLAQNRYLLDQFSHRLICLLTPCLTHMIEQGNAQGIFHVEFPAQTAAFLVTGYVFMSDEVKGAGLDLEDREGYVAAFRALLARSLGIDPAALRS